MQKPKPVVKFRQGRRWLTLPGLVLLAGCSVGMALSGNLQKDTSILFPGAPREAVITKLGEPETSSKDQQGRYTDSYLLVKGNSPSLGRAVGHATLDLLTLGIWEVVGTPIEAVAGSEDRSRLLIQYDAEQKLREYRKIDAN